MARGARQLARVGVRAPRPPRPSTGLHRVVRFLREREEAAARDQQERPWDFYGAHRLREMYERADTDADTDYVQEQSGSWSDQTSSSRVPAR